MGQLAANPWKVTGADALPLTVARGSVKIRHIEGSGWTVAGHTIVVNDINGNLITQLTGPTSLEEVRTGNIGYVTGIVVQSISAAGEQALIYFE